MRHPKKAMSQTVWIIVGIIVALATAVILIAMMSSTTSNTQSNTDNTIKSGGNSLKIITCKQLCDSCLRTHPSSNDCPGWGTDVGEGCAETNVGVSCPYDE